MGKFQRSLNVVGLLFVLPFFSAQAIEVHEGTISRNVDGDTVWVKLPEKDETLKIRMVEIDAPEWHLVTPGGTFGQGDFGEKAGQYLAELVPVGTDVEVKDFGKDAYGRTLGEVFVDGRDINLEMVKSGWAIPYLICGGKECTPKYFDTHNVDEYLATCETARSKGKGIFNPKKPLKEMPFEFRLRVQERVADKFVGDYETKLYYKPDQYSKVDLCKRIFFSKEADAKRAGFSKAD